METPYAALLVEKQAARARLDAEITLLAQLVALGEGTPVEPASPPVRVPTVVPPTPDRKPRRAADPGQDRRKQRPLGPLTAALVTLLREEGHGKPMPLAIIKQRVEHRQIIPFGPRFSIKVSAALGGHPELFENVRGKGWQLAGANGHPAHERKNDAPYEHHERDEHQ